MSRKSLNEIPWDQAKELLRRAIQGNVKLYSCHGLEDADGDTVIDEDERVNITDLTFPPWGGIDIEVMATNGYVLYAQLSDLYTENALPSNYKGELSGIQRSRR